MNDEVTAAPIYPVAIVGAGPVGLAMALGLARQGVRSVVLEQKPTTSRTSKAPGLHVRTREIFCQWGIEDRFLAAGRLMETVTMHSIVPGRKPLVHLDFSELTAEADRPGLVLLEQSETERLLLKAVQEAGMCEVRFESQVVGLDQGSSGVRLKLHEGGETRSLYASYVVGCDGAGSFVRQAIGQPFEGSTYGLRPMLADVRVDDERDALPEPRAWSGAGGYAFASRLRPGMWRIVHLPRGKPRKDEVPEQEVREQVETLLGPGPTEVLWSSRFRIHVRSSPHFRVGRVLLAGDAAHVHSPTSGFGMNGGIQDAHNLAWKLAAALNGGDADRLLDAYDVERRAVIVETTSRYTDWLTRTFLDTPAAIRETAFFLFRNFMKIASVRRKVLRRTAMIDLDYPASPLLRSEDRAAGVRLPNPILRGPDGKETRLYERLPNRPTVLEIRKDAGPTPDLEVKDVIRIGPGGYTEPAGVLQRMVSEEGGWVLVRPDAHIAWARQDAEGLDAAVRFALGEGVRRSEEPRPPSPEPPPVPW